MTTFDVLYTEYTDGDLQAIHHVLQAVKDIKGLHLGYELIVHSPNTHHAHPWAYILYSEDNLLETEKDLIIALFKAYRKDTGNEHLSNHS